MARVLAISSRVVRGHVGLDVTVPALQHLGHEVWAMPTIMLASRPGLGHFVRHDVPPSELIAMLGALEGDGCWPMLDAVFTGYFPSAEAVAAVAATIERITASRPELPVFVDPILGDSGRLYVAPETAAAIRDRLLPLATIASPNLFELSWLHGASLADAASAISAARRLGPPSIVITSAAETDADIATLAVTSAGHIERGTRRHPGLPNGPGDLFAGLLLGHLLRDLAIEPALDAALADLDRVLAASANKAVLDLSAL